MKNHTPLSKSKPDIARLEWARKATSPSYVKRAKHLSRLMKSYLAWARPVLVPFVEPPTRREFKETLHNALDTMTFEDRRRGRGKDRNIDKADGSSTDWAAPTTSLLY